MTGRAAQLRAAFETAEDDLRRAGAVPGPFRDETAVTVNGRSRTGTRPPSSARCARLSPARFRRASPPRSQSRYARRAHLPRLPRGRGPRPLRPGQKHGRGRGSQ